MTIDKTARRILAVLGEHGEMAGPRIADRLAIASGSVSHAMREHLLPEDYVVVTRTEENYGSAQDTHHYSLTEAGEQWLDAHADEVTIDSLDDMQDGVERAVTAAESARESVQRYRQKLSRANERSKENTGRIDDIEDDCVGMVELLRTQKNAREHADGLAAECDERIDRTQDSTKGTLQKFAKKMDAFTRDTVERIEALEETVESQQDIIEEQQERIDELESRRWFR